MEKIVLIDDVLCSLFSVVIGSNEVYVRDLESGFLKHTITVATPIQSAKEAARFVGSILVAESQPRRISGSVAIGFAA